MKNLITLTIFILIAFTSTFCQNVEFLDKNIQNNWPGFFDRIIGKTDNAIYFRMGNSNDIFFSDGTNKNTKTTGYKINPSSSTDDILFQDSDGDHIALGLGNEKNEIILFKNSSPNYDVIATELNSLTSLIIYEDAIFYAAARSTDAQIAIYKYNITDKSTSKIANFDNSNSIWGMCKLKSQIVVFGKKDSKNGLFTLNPVSLELTLYATLTDPPQFPKMVNMTVSDDKVYFFSTFAASKYSLFITDGTLQGSKRMLDNLQPYDEFVYRSNKFICGANGSIMFRAARSSDNKSVGRLFYADEFGGLKIEFPALDNLLPYDIVYTNNKYYFSAQTPFGHFMMNFNPAITELKILGDFESNGVGLFNDKLYTSADFPSYGFELAALDEKTDMFNLIKDINVGFSDSKPSYFTATKNNLFFISNLSLFDRVLTAFSDKVTTNADNSIENENLIKVYPNPFTDDLNIEIENKLNNNSAYSILNNVGQIVKKGVLSQGITTINLSENPVGLYHIISEGLSVPILKME